MLLIRPRGLMKTGRVRGGDAVRLWPKPEQGAASQPDFVGPARGGASVPLCRHLPRVARFDGKPRKKVQSAPKATQRGIMRRQHRKQRDEIVRPGHGNAKLHQQRLEVLLRRWLAVETHRVMQGNAAARESAGGEKVGLGLSNPLPGQTLHTGPFLAKRFLAGTSRLPQAATAWHAACAR